MSRATPHPPQAVPLPPLGKAFLSRARSAHITLARRAYHGGFAAYITLAKRAYHVCDSKHITALPKATSFARSANPPARVILEQATRRDSSLRSRMTVGGWDSEGSRAAWNQCEALYGICRRQHGIKVKPCIFFGSSWRRPLPTTRGRLYIIRKAENAKFSAFFAAAASHRPTLRQAQKLIRKKSFFCAKQGHFSMPSPAGEGGTSAASDG